MLILTAAPLMLALIVDPAGLAEIDDGPRTTRSGIFYNATRQSANHRQPKRQDYYHRHSGVVGRRPAPGSALRYVEHCVRGRIGWNLLCLGGSNCGGGASGHATGATAAGPAACALGCDDVFTCS